MDANAPPSLRKAPCKTGFTLIELSIVLVIIGLIVGGVLVGRDLIKASEIRAQISQIEQYNTAANTFKLKYGYLPGDMPSADALQAGFLRVGSGSDIGCDHYPSECGNGNGQISQAGISPIGEPRIFWLDLAVSGLIPNAFYTGHVGDTYTTTDISKHLPPAKIGGINYVYVYNNSGSGALSNDGVPVQPLNKNYFGIVGVKQYCGYNSGGCGTWGLDAHTEGAMSVISAYNIDQKIDDGLPITGSVRAAGFLYKSGYGGTITFADGNYAAWTGHAGGYGWDWVDRPAATNTCFDNNNDSNTVNEYSIGFNGGNGVNCALSFKMQ